MIRGELRMILVLSVFLLPISSPIFTENIFLLRKEFGIDVSRISRNEQEKLSEVFMFIDSFQTEKLYFSEKFYRKRSKFQKLFGFPFSGKKLNEWILSRIKKIKIQKIKDYTALNSGTELTLSDSFLQLSVLEQSIILVHEARHSDGREFAHTECPANFAFLSQRNPEAVLSELYACDDREDGAYGFSAAFLFELIAYTGKDRENLIGRYNSELSRIVIKR